MSGIRVPHTPCLDHFTKKRNGFGKYCHCESQLAKRLRNSIQRSLDLALSCSRHEDRLYAVINEIFHAISLFVTPKAENDHAAWVNHPQHLLVPHGLEDMSSKHFLNLLLQGAFALQAFPTQQIIYVFFFAGCWFTLLRFKRPQVESEKTAPQCSTSDTQNTLMASAVMLKEFQIAGYVPEKNKPSVPFYAEPIFDTDMDQADGKYTWKTPLILSQKFCEAVSLMCSELNEDFDILESSLFASTIHTANVSLPVEKTQRDEAISYWYELVEPPKTPKASGSKSAYEESPIRDLQGNVIEEDEGSLFEPSPSPWKGKNHKSGSGFMSQIAQNKRGRSVSGEGERTTSEPSRNRPRNE
ncbi:hypothetical protein K435DRAFT_865120 [Dendrothele bispora CBS 962.96]|uniref:Uncharacterized protein n=1 Tax=Dendrothele bispora (strain CBS 962.96) TaxID=1314807 RepID=A0A4V4HE54_DENBC|nr:hypothetical protein K435DRAFT_865120 [Dendrothele bispora CBS 962.96]